LGGGEGRITTIKTHSKTMTKEDKKKKKPMRMRMPLLRGSQVRLSPSLVVCIAHAPMTGARARVHVFQKQERGNKYKDQIAAPDALVKLALAPQVETSSHPGIVFAQSVVQRRPGCRCFVGF
jgi:hypothetical protein